MRDATITAMLIVATGYADRLLNSEQHREFGTLRLGRTDAAGVLYFARALEICHEAIESFLDSRKIDIALLMKDGPLLPVVHVEADFRSPLAVGDGYCTIIESVECSARSVKFALRLMSKDGRTIVTAHIVHACIHATEGGSMEIPASLRKALTPAT